MFYLKDYYYDVHGEDKKLVIVDTSDNVEETYPQEVVFDAIRKSRFNLKILGITYSGSDFRLQKYCRSLVYLRNLSHGDCLKLIYRDSSYNPDRYVLYLGEGADFVTEKFLDIEGKILKYRKDRFLHGIVKVQLYKEGINVDNGTSVVPSGVELELKQVYANAINQRR